MILHGDLETFSAIPIKNGTYRYAEDAEIMLFTYAFDNEPVQCWDLTTGEAMPFDLEMALEDESVILNFQNSMFDRTVFRLAVNSTPLLRAVGDQQRRWRDTMIKALAHSLPGGLDRTGEILKIDLGDSKHTSGKNLIQLFCKPRPVNSTLRRATKETHPDDWETFKLYAMNDISAMRAVDRKLPSWNYNDTPGTAGELELKLWHLDQKINDRGVCIDIDLAHAAIEAAEKAKADLARRTVDITNGEVEKATQRDKMLLHILAEYGIDLPDMKSSTLERRIDDPDLPVELRELLDIRLQASMGSTSKYKSMLKAVNKDGRVRGLLQFNGANRTRRWAGRTVQPQNMFRPVKYVKKDWEFVMSAIKSGSVDLIYPNVMEVTASAARGGIIAAPGKKLVVADLANIEGRDQAWLAGEEWKMQAFREYDAGTGPDLYKLAYAKAFRIDPSEVDDYQRQIGKVLELMLGYEGGVGAFMTGALTYGFDIEEMAEEAYPHLPSDAKGEAESFYAYQTKMRRSTFGLSKRGFVTCDAFKRLWRGAHSNVSALWGEMKEAVIDAIQNPGKTFICRRFKMRRDGAWLRIGLPSGRCLCYPSPEVDEKGNISYMGVNQYTRKWQRVKSYGGKFFENCIAEGTEVLTDSGWLAIESVTPVHKVWDGVEWVAQDGTVYKGKQFTLSVFNVTMTPDHLVLTTKGWRNASSCEGYNRAPSWVLDSNPLSRLGWQKIAVGGPVPMREDYRVGSYGTKEAEGAWHNRFLRVPEESNNRGKEPSTRNVSPSGVCRVQVNDRQMPTSNTPGLAQLRRARDYCLYSLAGKFRKLLGGHGTVLPTWFNFGTNEQHEGLLAKELQLADGKASSQQPANKSQIANTSGRDDSIPSSRPLRGKADDATLPARERMVDVESVRAVYDLMNCGPRSRFVVRGSDGQPLIVHNCCQALARDVMADNMPEIERQGYAIILSVHDELITEVPDSPEFTSKRLSELLSANPPWAPDMPLAAAGWEGKRYKKD